MMMDLGDAGAITGDLIDGAFAAFPDELSEAERPFGVAYRKRRAHDCGAVSARRLARTSVLSSSVRSQIRDDARYFSSPDDRTASTPLAFEARTGAIIWSKNGA